MKHTKLRDLIQLATELQATSVGLTIEDLMQRTERSRRSVYRMLDGLYELGLEPQQLQLEQDHHLTKRWRIEGGLPTELLTLEMGDRAALERHWESLEEGVAKRTIAKVLAAQDPLSKRLIYDQEMLIERSANLGSVGPKTEVDQDLVKTLESALQGLEEVELSYRAVGKPRATKRLVRPLGMLFGRFTYLVASTGNRAPIIYRLDLIQNATLAGSYFEERKNWNLKEWAEESFGVYHGDALLDVRLRFSKEVAQRAAKVTFHPSQKTEKSRDGSLIVYLKVRGHQELFHELCHPDWVTNVKIEAPDSLVGEYKRYLRRLEKAVV